MPSLEVSRRHVVKWSAFRSAIRPIDGSPKLGAGTSIEPGSCSLAPTLPRGDPETPPVKDDLTASSENDAILNTFDNAFEAGRWFGIHEGTHLRAPDGTVGKYVSYWGSCKSRASELLGQPAEPGVDYALTEVVRPF